IAQLRGQPHRESHRALFIRVNGVLHQRKGSSDVTHPFGIHGNGDEASINASADTAEAVTMGRTWWVVDQRRLDAHGVGTTCSRYVLATEQHDEVGCLVGVALDLEGRVRTHAGDRESGGG